MNSEELNSVLLGKKDNASGSIKTSFLGLDKLFGGFRKGNTYLLAGLEKSGKTSLLLNWVSEIIRHKKVFFLSTEMNFHEIIERLGSIRKISFDWRKSEEKSQFKLDVESNFDFSGIDELITEGGISVTKTESLVESKIWAGTDLVILDNLTTFGSQQTGTEATWIKVAVAITKVINLAKTNKVPVIIVLHIKPHVTFRETPMGMRDMIRQGTPERIFEQSVTVINRPSLADVYGGGGVLSQLSGALLLWRPYQKYVSAQYRRMASLILDSMRHSESGLEMRLDYDGASGIFNEVDADFEQKVINIFT